jgi:hypothetical protein
MYLENVNSVYVGLADTIHGNAYTTGIAATALIKRMNVGYAY